MSLRRNVIANYASQIYVTLVGIVVVPIYLRHMGSEAYGLVGFFASIQALFGLLDIGLAPTMARETARLTAGKHDASSYRQLFHSIQTIFVIGALIGCLVILAGAESISRHWLHASQLPPADITRCIELMAPTIALRWMAGLHRSVISGFEQFSWLSACNAIVASLRFLGVLPVILLIDNKPTTFFIFQLCVAITEYIILYRKCHKIIPPASAAYQNISWSIATFRSAISPVFGFSLNIAFTTIVGIATNQADKIVLSTILPLGEYGHYTLAVLVASSVLMISTPITTAYIPRLTQLKASSEQYDIFVATYRRMTRLVAAIVAPVSCVLAVASVEIISVWTNDKIIATEVQSTVALYVIGYAFYAITALVSHLQVAHGDLSLHTRGVILFAITYLCMLMPLAKAYGAVGAGIAWLASNLLYILAWIPLIHTRFIPGVHLQWIFKDWATTYILCFSASLLTKNTLALIIPNVPMTATIAIIAIISFGTSTARHWRDMHF
jgi:O-antigen/teichoic acid export membrane protein